VQPSPRYNLHDHISTCYQQLDEAIKNTAHVKHRDAIKLVISENWMYDNCGSAPQFAIDTFKYVLPRKQAVKSLYDLPTEYVNSCSDTI
jgi:hypothetical protein